MQRYVLALLILGLLLTACTGMREPRTLPSGPSATAVGHELAGVASWYGDKFHGRRTANGEVYDMHLLTAAHKTLPFHTLVKVTRLDDGRSVTVRINDRGPFVAGRIIDLSYAAAKRLGMADAGTARVRLDIEAAGETPLGLRETQVVVQAGAFGEPANAAARAGELNRRFGGVFNVKAVTPWYRVVSLPMPRGEAEELCRRLRRLNIDAFVREEP